MAKQFYPGIMGKVVSNEPLNVRTKVSKGKYEIVKGDQLKRGTVVKLLAYEDHRYKIDYKGKDGYIYDEFVELLD